MTIKKLINSWTLPDRTNERTQITLRLDFDTYARLHALKDIFPSRSVNEIINDILSNGLNEIIEALPSRQIFDESELLSEGIVDEYNRPLVGASVGLKVNFDAAYRKILQTKSSEEVESNA